MKVLYVNVPSASIFQSLYFKEVHFKEVRRFDKQQAAPQYLDVLWPRSQPRDDCSSRSRRLQELADKWEHKCKPIMGGETNQGLVLLSSTCAKPWVPKSYTCGLKKRQLSNLTTCVLRRGNVMINICSTNTWQYYDKSLQLD